MVVEGNKKYIFGIVLVVVWKGRGCGELEEIVEVSIVGRNRREGRI